MPQRGIQQAGTELAVPAGKHGIVLPVADREFLRAGYFLFLVLVAGRQLAGRTQRQVVLPGQGVLRGREAAIVGPPRIARGKVLRAVHRLAQGQGAVPAFGQLVFQVDAVGLDTVFLDVVDLPGQVLVGIVLCAAERLEGVEADFVPFGQQMADPHAVGSIAIAVFVRVVIEVVTVGRRKTAVGGAMGHVNGKRGVPHHAADAGAHAPGAVIAGSQRQVRCRCAPALAGENLHHAADGVGTVQARHRPAHDLDALDLLQRDLFQRRGPGSGRHHAHAVDQHDRLVAVGAADEQRGLAAVTAVAGKFDAGFAGQQLRQACRTGPGNIVAGDHRHVAGQAGGLHGRTGGRDHGFGDFSGRGGGKGRADGQRHAAGHKTENRLGHVNNTPERRQQGVRERRGACPGH